MSGGGEEVRITWARIGAIRHRPTTKLLPPKECEAGHRAPRYRAGMQCVVCAKERAYEAQGLAWPVQRPGKNERVRYFTRYADARAWYEEAGGFLLSMGGKYGVTDHEPTVRRLRSDRFMDRCDAMKLWDEVEIAARQPRK